MKSALLVLLAVFLLGAAAPKTEHQGTLEVWHEDHEPAGQYLLKLKTDKETVELKFPKGHKLDPSKYKTGQKVKIRGHKRRGELVMDLESESDIEPQSSASPRSFSTDARRTLVFVVSYKDTPPQIDLAGAQTVMQAVSDFFRSQSSGTTWLAGVKNPNQPGDIFLAPTQVVDSGNCDRNVTDLWNGAKVAAVAAGYAHYDIFQQLVLNDIYDRQVFLFPSMGCGWSGSATVGGPTSWINAQYTLRVIGHEMGHNDGHYHNHSEGCNAAPGCGMQEYGNFLAMMGNTSGTIRMAERERIGWPTSYQLVTQPGDYAVEAFDVDGSKIKALKIPIPGTNDSYWATFNSGQGPYGNGKPIAPFIERSGSNANSYYLLGWVTGRGDYQLGCDPNTDIMDDPIKSIYITCKSKTPTQATINVSFIHPLYPAAGYAGTKYTRIVVPSDGQLFFGRKYTWASLQVTLGQIVYCQDDNFGTVFSLPGNEPYCLFQPGGGGTLPNPPINLTLN